MDIRGIFTANLQIRGQLKREIAAIATELSKRIEVIASRVKEKDYQGLTDALTELMEYNTYVLEIDTQLRLSEKADERSVVIALDNIQKMLRYARDDVRAISQLAMNEANNAT